MYWKVLKKKIIMIKVKILSTQININTSAQQGLSYNCHPIRDLQNQRLWKVAPLRTVVRENPMEEENKENQIHSRTNFLSVALRCSQNTAWVPSEKTWKMMTESSSRFGYGSPHFPLPLVVWRSLVAGQMQERHVL